MCVVNVQVTLLQRARVRACVRACLRTCMYIAFFIPLGFFFHQHALASGHLRAAGGRVQAAAI